MSRNTFSISNLDNSSYNDLNRLDRFIPSRPDIGTMIKTIRSEKIINHKSEMDVDSDKINDENIFYKDLLYKNLLKKNVTKSFNELEFIENYDEFIIPKFKKVKKYRKIDTTPFKILDAPLLQDDYYINVVDWSATNNLAVGLANIAYVWNFETNEVNKILELEEENFISCIKWDKNGKNLIVGNLEGNVQIFDFEKKKEIIKFTNHMERVGAISFHQNLLLTGSRDTLIYLYDIRTKSKPMKRYDCHKQEVCGLEFSSTGKYFASGGNDNKLNVFSLKTDFPLFRKSHKAAVKAISWSNRNINLLATGAGTADRCLRIFNMSKKKMINCKDTGSQICNLKFSKNEDEIISAHGFSKNEVVVWKVKNLDKVVSFSGHTSRVLYMSLSPDGNCVITGAGDETLRFWGLNYKEKKNVVKGFNDLNIYKSRGLR